MRKKLAALCLMSAFALSGCDSINTEESLSFDDIDASSVSDIEKHAKELSDNSTEAFRKIAQENSLDIENLDADQLKQKLCTSADDNSDLVAIVSTLNGAPMTKEQSKQLVSVVTGTFCPEKVKKK